AVQLATDEYRGESDVVGQFISECCLTGQAYRVKFSTLFERLQEWCADAGNNVPSKKFVGKYLVERGHPDKHSGGRWYLGIAVKDIEHSDYSAEMNAVMSSF
ncbi:MAG TPA: primase-like DNA-binding domain-containing protein, partial [Schlesneria sp.]